MTLATGLIMHEILLAGRRRAIETQRSGMNNFDRMQFNKNIILEQTGVGFNRI
jgi:hypothetical protein